MIRSKLRKDSLNDLISLSCVENYIFGFLKEKNINISLLYYASYVPFKRVFNDFHQENIQYAFFNSIPRLQQVAKDNHIIDLCHNDKVSLNDIEKNEGPLLTGVKLEYFRERYNATPWREDHYFYIEKVAADKYYFINDNPRDDGYLTKNEIEKLHDGQIIKFKITGSISESNKLDFLIKFREDLIKEDPQLSGSFKLIELKELQTRDFFGVLRISRQRIERFLSNYFNTDFMKDYLLLLNKHYTAIEYERLRRKSKFEILIERIEITERYDKQILKLINEKVGGFLNEYY